MAVTSLGPSGSAFFQLNHTESMPQRLGARTSWARSSPIMRISSRPTPSRATTASQKAGSAFFTPRSRKQKISETKRSRDARARAPSIMARFDTDALVATAIRCCRDSVSSTSRAPSMTRTSGQSAMGRSGGPSSDIRVSPQSKRMQR